MPPAFDEPALPQTNGATEPESVSLPSPGADGPQDPLEPLATQFDFGLRTTTDIFVESARVWSQVSRAYIDAADASRRAFGEFLIDWHQRFLRPPER